MFCRFSLQHLWLAPILFSFALAVLWPLSVYSRALITYHTLLKKLNKLFENSLKNMNNYLNLTRSLWFRFKRQREWYERFKAKLSKIEFSGYFPISCQREVTFIAKVPQWRPLFMVSKKSTRLRVKPQIAETNAVSQPGRVISGLSDPKIRRFWSETGR